MKGKILDGKKLSEKILEKIKKEIQNRHLKLKLAVILVGENPVSEIFIHQKKKACEFAEIDFKLYKFPKNINSVSLKKEIRKISSLPRVSGVVIQLPLPQNLNIQEILNLIPIEKDVDCLSERSLSEFYLGSLKILPPTLQGIIEIFKNYKIKTRRKNFVVIGVSRLIGLPLAFWLLTQKATVSVLDKFTPDISFFSKSADILISGVGKAGLISGKMVKKGVVVIDAGTSLKDGKLRGDVDFKSVSKKASYITPVPGGVGPLTVACLLENMVKLTK